MRSDYDHKTRRCPKLGHDITFSYCRAPGTTIPCSMIRTCWWESFDVASYLKEHCSEQDIKELGRPAKMKSQSLIEIMAEVESRIKKSKSS